MLFTQFNNNIQKKRFILVDCNNFFVSCERVFNPALHKKPVVILSNNDGCIISRSNEAKLLGIPMGAPVFEYEAIVRKNNVAVFSSNFALYGDMSRRIMHILSQCSSNLEIYSIDEAFLFIHHNVPLHTLQATNFFYNSYGRHIKFTIQKQTGIPVSIGIGPTKTLAKIANFIAKKNPEYKGVFDITAYCTSDIDKLLATIAIRDVWGIGSRYAKLLENKNIFTAYDFKNMSEYWVRKNMTVIGLKTLFELRGLACLSLQEVCTTKKSLTVSRALGKPATNKDILAQALACHVTRGCEKLRAQKSLAARLTIFIIGHCHRRDYTYYNSADFVFEIGTDYTPAVITAAHRCLDAIFKPEFVYKKVGILLSNLTPVNNRQTSLFQPEATEYSYKQDTLMHTIDTVNNKWGSNKLFFAAAGTKREWQSKREKLSSCFTTNWKELLTITI